MKKITVLSLISIIFFVFIKCSGPTQADSKDPRGKAFASSATCISCHKNVADSYLHNAHFKTSAKANYNYLSNTHIPLHDTIWYKDDQRVIIDGKNSDVHQTAYKGDQMINSETIDLAFGSAGKAQTYAYWKADQLYELPATWLAGQKLWTNSPGFPASHPYFTRIIPSRCFECHASYVQSREERVGTTFQTKQIFDQSSIIYGIDCERCHGPAAQHVKFHQENPTVKQAKFMTSIRSLSRQQQLDMCGICHAGDPVKLKSIFNFKPGDSLSNYYLYFNGVSAEPDVHGMQLQLLRSSKCYQQSQLTCLTCHSPHGDQPTSATCITCHQQVTHTTDITVRKSDCISCHMPLRSSKSLDFNNQSGTNKLQYTLRTHRIAIYPEK